MAVLIPPLNSFSPAQAQQLLAALRALAAAIPGAASAPGPAPAPSPSWLADLSPANIVHWGKIDYPAAYFVATNNSYLIGDAGDTASDASYVARVQGNVRMEIGIVGDTDVLTGATTQDIHFKSASGTYLSEVFSNWMTRHSDTRGSYYGLTDFTSDLVPSVGSAGDNFIRVYGNSNRNGVLFGDTTIPAFPGRFGEGGAVFYDFNASTLFIYSALWGVVARDIQLGVVNNFRVSPGAVFANANAFVCDALGGVQVGQPLRRAAAPALVTNAGTNVGLPGAPVMTGYVPGVDIVSPVVSAGIAPAYPLSTTYVSGASVTAAGTGGTPSPATTLTAPVAANATAIPVASTTGFAPGDLIDIQTNALGYFETTILSIVGSTINLNAAVPAACNAGNNVYDSQGRVVTGTTGTGTKAQLTVQINNAGGIAQVLQLHALGAYTVNPANLANEPVTGAGLAGAALTVTMGALALAAPTNPGALNIPPPVPASSTSTGAGTGALLELIFSDSFALNAASLQIDGQPLASPSIGISNPQVVYVGDSLTAGYPGNQIASAAVPSGHTGHSYDRYINLPAYRGLAWSDVNVGIGGITAATILANLPDNVERLFLPAAPVNIALVWAGRNDIAGGATAAATYASLTSIVAALHGFGWKVGLCTMISGADDAGGNTIDAALATLRTSINGNAAGADFIVDLGGNAHLQPGLGTPAWQNTTYYQADGLTDVGYALAGSIAQAALATYIGTLPTAHAWNYRFGGHVEIDGDLTASGAAGEAQFYIRGIADTTQELQLGYRTDQNLAFIQAARWGIVGSPLNLNPYGGNILVGPKADDGVTPLQVAGAAKVSVNNAFVTTLLTLENQSGTGLGSEIVWVNNGVTTHAIVSTHAGGQNILQIGPPGAAATINADGSVAIAGPALGIAEIAFANAPGAPAVGTECNFSDSTTAVWGATIAGGGGNHVLGRWNGAHWTVVGA